MREFYYAKRERRVVMLRNAEYNFLTSRMEYTLQKGKMDTGWHDIRSKEVQEYEYLQAKYFDAKMIFNDMKAMHVNKSIFTHIYENISY